MSHYGSQANDWFVGPGAAAAVHSVQMRNQVRAWQTQMAANQAAALQPATTTATDGADMAAQITWDDVEAALLSGDPELAQAAIDVVEEELGGDAAQEAAQNLHHLYVQEHGEDVAAGYLNAIGFEVEDDAEELIGEDLTEEEVADILDEEIGRLEEEQGREFSPEEVEQFVNHAMSSDDEGVEENAEPEAEEDYFETGPTVEEVVEEQVEALESKLGRELSSGELERMRGHVDEKVSVAEAHEWFGKHPGDRVDEQQFGENANSQPAPPSRHERVSAMTEKLTDPDPDHNLMLAAAQLADKHERQDAEYEQTGRLSADLVTAYETGDWSAVA